MIFNMPESEHPTDLLEHCPWALKNQTRDPHEVAESFHNVAYPLLLTICTIGNSVSLCVLPKGRKTSTTNIFLICMAVADIFIVWFYMDNFIYQLLPELYRNSESSFYRFYWRAHGAVRWWRGTCIQFSDWTLLAFSVVRFLSVTRPMNYRYYPRKKTVLLELAIFVAAGLFNVHFLAHRYSVTTDINGNPRIRPLVEWWHSVMVQLEVLVSILKWTLIMSFNCVIAVKLASQRHAGQSRKGGSVRFTRHKTYETRGFKTLLGSAVLYTLSRAPSVCTTIYYLASRPPYCQFEIPLDRQSILFPTVNIFLLCNYTFNFVIYCFSSPSYRRCFQWMCSKKTGRSQGKVVTFDPVEL